MITPTAKQLKIRDYEGLSLLIVAPAGCGKTESLALRIAGIVQRGAVAHSQRVLATTFTNRARDNLRDRLRSYLPATVIRDRVTIANFHGVAARLFRAHAAIIGLDREMALPESDWVREQCGRRGLGFDEARNVQDVLRTTKQAALDDAAVKELLRRSGNPVALEIEQLRLTENRLTYDDLPRLAELILANDQVAQLYRSHFAAVVVDEYQDLTPQQLRMVNLIGSGRTTYAGDLAQGIYGFAGARPIEIEQKIRGECQDIIEFNESHRSSPAVLSMVNSLRGVTGGQTLTCAKPETWPGGGLAGGIGFGTVTEEAAWAVTFARFILSAAPNQRVAIVGRTKPRLRFVDSAVEQSGLPFYRWEDGMLDTETARLFKVMLARLDLIAFGREADPLAYLRHAADLESVQDPNTRENLADALNWCLNLLQDGLGAAEIRARIRVGGENTLLSAPGVHLLNGHLGKGQQFDWVAAIGAEDGCIPDFRAASSTERAEEARILSVMLSRARHGVVVTCAGIVPAANGKLYNKKPSPYFQYVRAAPCRDQAGIAEWLASVAWDEVSKR